MKVLITGGMGVIGAETTRKFINEGHRPIVFARHRDDSLVADIAGKFDFEGEVKACRSPPRGRFVSEVLCSSISGLVHGRFWH